MPLNQWHHSYNTPQTLERWFRELLDSGSLTSRTQAFVESLHRDYSEKGFLTERQAGALKDIWEEWS